LRHEWSAFCGRPRVSTDAEGHAKVKVAVVANSCWYLYNFRRNLMEALREAGHEVIAVAPADAYVQRLRQTGVEVGTFALDPRGTNPVRELRSVLALRRLLRSKGMDVALSYTPKGNLYTALAQLGTRGRQVANISGLGTAFVRSNWLTPLLRAAYRVLFRHASWVFFQNEDDRQMFLQAATVRANRCSRLPGSGVDLQHFAPQPLPSCVDVGPVTFLLVARMLRDKGIGEYVGAARTLQRSRPGMARFLLLGFLDAGNPSAISADEMARWVADGSVEYLGPSDDIRPHMAAADCAVLPSYYREGVPRSLLEAAAMGRPVITTDSVGCRDAVEDGVTGFLCRPRDVADLTRNIERFIDMPPTARVAMGRQARARMEREFDERLVIHQYLKVVDGVAPAATA
jgi:glycosyltransferase involved in cell wall biosynthesis